MPYVVYAGVDGKPITDAKGNPREVVEIKQGGNILAELPFCVPVEVKDPFVLRCCLKRRWQKPIRGLKAALFSDNPLLRDAARGYVPKQYQYIQLVDEIDDPRVKAVIAKREKDAAIAKLQDALKVIKSYKADTSALEKELNAAIKEAEKYEKEASANPEEDELNPETAEEFVAWANKEGFINEDIVKENTASPNEVKFE